MQQEEQTKTLATTKNQRVPTKGTDKNFNSDLLLTLIQSFYTPLNSVGL